MENLLKGIVEFRKQDFETHRELFSRIGNQQQPHTLFIGCSDSRVVPGLITKTLPGEIFVVRNIANMVPPYRASEEFLATTSAIEYAVQALNVVNIIVCGHSNCGGCAALFKNDEEMASLPHTRKWLELSAGVRKKVEHQLPYPDDTDAREWLTEQINVVEQMQHLLSYPFIRERFESSAISISGWHYIIETGEVFAYNRKLGFFELIN